MRRKHFLIGLSLAALLISLISLLVMAEPDDPEIVGGEEAVPGAWPWQVAFVHSDALNLYDGQYCAGVLVDDLWVLTAAHCVDDYDPGDFYVALGVHNLLDPEPNHQRLSPRNIIIHPDFNTDLYDSDIALVQLATPALLTAGEGGGLPVQPLKLVATDAGSLEGVLSTVTGWGNRAAQPDPGGFDYPETLHQVKLPIISNEACDEAFYNNYLNATITENMMCAGFVYKGGRDSCYGDSGGPLVIQEPQTDEWRLAGLVSWGFGCALPGVPGVYTRLSQFSSWVTEIVERPDVTLEKSAGSLAVTPGGVLGYNLLLKNFGSYLVEDLVLSDEVPGGTTVVPGSISGGGVLQDGVVAWEVPPLGPAESFSADFSILVDDDYLSTADHFSDDIEGDLAPWSVSHDPAFADFDWSVSDTMARTGLHAWFALNPEFASDQYLVLSVPGALPPDMALSFWHFYDLEAGYDGGVIEISTDNGGTWTDLGPYISENGYDYQLSSGIYSALAGREVFSGYSVDWIQTRVALDSYSGQEVQIRFRLASDDVIGAWGWFVDDILIGRHAKITNQAMVTGVPSNITETAVLSWLPTENVFVPVLVPAGNENYPPPGYP